MRSIAVSTLVLGASTFASEPVTQDSLGTLPIQEVTIFKDGHALVVQEGRAPTDANGDVLLKDLPRPVMGTFWPYSAGESVRLAAVVAGTREVTRDQPVHTVRDAIMASIGSRVRIREGNAERDVEIIDVRNNAAQQAGHEVVLLRDGKGIRFVPLSSIHNVTFFEEPPATFPVPAERPVLRLDLDWEERTPSTDAEVGFVYVQRGIRWIPSYRVTLSDDGIATIDLEATLINELHDLNNVRANLVVGVPSFRFSDTPDPIGGVDWSPAQLSQYFQQNTGRGRMFSNAIMTQTARMNEVYHDMSGHAGNAPPTTPELSDQTKNEDLFVFGIERLTLAKGERMTLPVTTFEIPYEDVFALSLPFSPPPDVYWSFNGQHQDEIARLLARPKVKHLIRFRNTSDVPLTTAPALFFKNDTVLAQGMMMYTGIGGSVDVEMTTAVDVHVKRRDREVQRTPDAEKAKRTNLMRVDLEGVITLTNHRGTPVKLEIRRFVLGNVDRANEDGEVSMIHLLEDGSYLDAGARPTWWGWYSWPWWWHRFNGIGEIRWEVDLPADDAVDLTYNWHYFWG